MAWTVTTTKPDMTDFIHIAQNIRQADRDEVFELNALTPMQALTLSARDSDFTCAVRLNDEPVVILGVGTMSLLTGRGIPWMLGTDKIFQNASIFLHMTKKIFPVITSRYTYLTNVVHEDNRRSINWLKYMGFEFGEPQPIGWRGANFRVFAKEC